MASSLGLPRFVVTFLRHMECHKEYLKWNISEGSHKITLTLTWNFRSKSSKTSSVSENLLDKLQRTINLVRTPESEPSVTPDLSKILETAPKKHKKTPIKQRLSLTMGAIRRTLSTSSSQSSPSRRQQESFRRSSSFTLPTQSCLYHQPANHIGSSSSVKLPRHNSFHHCGATRLLSPVRGTANLPSSPSKSSFGWAGTARSLYSTSHRSADDLDHSVDDLDGSGSPPLLDTATGSSCCSETGFTSTRPRVKLTYRSEDELEESLEDIMERRRKDTQAKLDDIQKEWNETLREWPQILKKESSRTSRYRNPPPSLSSTFLSASGSTPEQTDTEQKQSVPQPGNMQNLQGADVSKCLDSCEKILKRYETDIT